MRRVLSLLFLTFLSSVHPVWAEDPVVFVDPVLKTAVEAELWISDPTPSDMLGLTELVRPRMETTDNAVESLAGLEYALNLQTLNLRYHLVSDLSPLSGLANLETLVLHGNLRISDLSPLSGLTRLRTLDLIRNEIHDISALSGLANLTWLSLHRNHIGDILPLSGLTSLGFLDLRINPLNDDAYGTYLEQISANNPAIQLLYDSFSHRRLLIDSTIGGSVVVPGEGAFTYEYGTPVWLLAEADPGFAFVRFTGNCSSSQNPMTLALDQDYELLACFESVLDTVHVDDDAAEDPGPGNAWTSDPRENGTAAHPFDRIQEAIDVAARGTRVLVHPGTYREQIDFRGKCIQVTGIDPNGSNPMCFPVLDGDHKGPVVRFTGREDSSCILKGFVITRGQGSGAGAILCSNSSPTITHCLIVGNRATDPNGAAIYCTDSDATFANCTIAGNAGSGLCVVDSNVVLSSSIVWGNTPEEIVVRGNREFLANYSDVSGGWPGLGNINADPLFVRPGRWTDPADPGAAVAPENLHAIWVAGDYHVQSPGGRWDPEMENWVTDKLSSPCIDRGDPRQSVGDEPRPNGDAINLGAYGGTAQAGKSS